MSREMAVIQKFQEIARALLAASRNVSGSIEIGNGFLCVEGCSLENCGQKSRIPMVGTHLRNSAGIGNGDKRGQVLVLGPERVADPRTHAGEAIEYKPSAHLVFGWPVCIGPGR